MDEKPKKIIFCQLKIFPEIIKSISLIADSPKKAFYNLRLEFLNNRYRVYKESGALNKILDKRIWFCSSIQEAEKLYSRIIKTKTNQKRKRTYRITI